MPHHNIPLAALASQGLEHGVVYSGKMAFQWIAHPQTPSPPRLCVLGLWCEEI